MHRRDHVSLSPSVIRLLAGIVAWAGLPPSIFYALEGRLGWTIPVFLVSLGALVTAVSRRATLALSRRRFMPQLVVLLLIYLAFGALVEIYMAITFVPYSPTPRIPTLLHGISFLGLTALLGWKLREELVQP